MVCRRTTAPVRHLAMYTGILTKRARHSLAVAPQAYLASETKGTLGVNVFAFLVRIRLFPSNARKYSSIQEMRSFAHFSPPETASILCTHWSEWESLCKHEHTVSPIAEGRSLAVSFVRSTLGLSPEILVPTADACPDVPLIVRRIDECPFPVSTYCSSTFRSRSHSSRTICESKSRVLSSKLLHYSPRIACSNSYTSFDLRVRRPPYTYIRSGTMNRTRSGLARAVRRAQYVMVLSRPVVLSSFRVHARAREFGFARLLLPRF